MNKKILQFIEWGKQNNCEIEMNGQGYNEIPIAIKERYQKIDKEYLSFIQQVNIFVARSEKKWFLTNLDFLGKAETAYSWNEFEKMSIEISEGDVEWENEIIQFWDKHLPIMLSVDNSYSYFAIEVDTGYVVYGSEPEFEETEKVANTFIDFLIDIMNNQINFK